MPSELSPQEEEAFRKARAVIDDAIRYAGFSEHVSIPSLKLPTLSFRAVDRLCAAYRQMGWHKAEMHDDPQAGEVFDLQA